MKNVVGVIIIGLLIVTGYLGYTNYTLNKELKKTQLHLSITQKELRISDGAIEQALELAYAAKYDFTFSNGLYVHYFKDGYIVAVEPVNASERYSLSTSYENNEAMIISSNPWNENLPRAEYNIKENIMRVNEKIYDLKVPVNTENGFGIN